MRNTPLILSATLAAALCPALTHAEPTGNAKLVADAKASPGFEKSIKRGQLKKAKLEIVPVAPGIDMDFQKYVRDTALDTQPLLQPLFDPKLRAEWLTAAAKYTEDIHVLDDRFVVERRLTVPLAPGACSRPGLPDAIAKICFVKNPAQKTTKAIGKELKTIRAGLAKADPSQVVHGTVTAAAAAKLDDEQLLDLLLNGDGRTIHHVSIVPRAQLPAGGKGPIVGLAEIGPSDTKLGTGAIDLSQGSQTFATDYFITGFTYGREFEDSWEYTIANETWLTDRYYIHLGYHFGAGFGVRAPFSVAVKSAGSSTNRQVELAVAPVDVDNNGNPAYPAAGMPQGQYFDGNEFVLELKASCELYVSVPGPNLDAHCPTIDKGWSRDIKPVIGSESSAIADWWLDGSVTGLALSFPIAKATLDLGVGADVTNGKIGVTMTGLGSAGFASGAGGAVWIDSRNARSFGMTRSAGDASAKLRLEQPRYRFDVRVRPKLRAKIDLDVAIYEHQWILGPFALDFLAVSKSFVLGRHDGTVASHDYPVFDGGTGDTLDPNIGSELPPTKGPKTKGPIGGALPPSAGKMK
jgi:hypothetical protein